MRPWRIRPVQSQLEVLFVAERLVIRSPHCQHPPWLRCTVAAVALCVAFQVLMAIVVLSPNMRAFGVFGLVGLWLAGWWFVGWEWPLRSQRWFELRVTRDTWSVGRVWRMQDGLSWRASQESGPTAQLHSAKVGPRPGSY